MIFKGCERDCHMRGHQLVAMALFMAVLASGVRDGARTVFAAADSTILVSSVDELYATVNDAANIGAAVVLAPGVYTLSTTDAGGAPRPNGGRLELQADMSLYGVVGDRSAVVIDAARLPASAFAVPFGRTGVIRVGRGSNAIEWLTIAGNPNAAAAVETDLPGASPTAIRVAHLVAGDSARGVDVRNVGGNNGNAGRQIQAEIADSAFFRGVEGIRVINFNGAHGGEITVAMQGNRSYANVLGCIVENNRSNSATIFVRSNGDRFQDNGLGCEIGGGLVGATPGVANENTTMFEAHGTQFTNNNRTVFFNDTGPAFTDSGGLLVVAGDVVNMGSPNSVSGNTVTVRLWGSKIAGNQHLDLFAFGARCTVSICGDGSSLSNPPKRAATNNHAVVELHGVSKFVEVVAVDSEPPDPDGTSSVTVIRRP
jgi:hypothetical protein